MIRIETGELIQIYNDGILILEGKNFQEIKDLIQALLKGNSDIWEVELLKNILYTIYNNLSTMEVA